MNPGFRRQQPVVLHITTLVAISWLLLITTNRSATGQADLEALRDLSKELERSSLSYDTLHAKLVEHQWDNYREPIKFPNARKNVRSLNGMFDFCFDTQQKGFSRGWHRQSLMTACSPSDYYRMPVPSAFNEILTNSSAQNYMGWFWYQTSIAKFTLGGQLRPGERLLLQFESINYLALVYVQGSLVGSHVGGHLPVLIDLTNFTRDAWPESLRITVAVSNMLTENTIPSGQMVDLSCVVGRKYSQFRPDFDFFHFAGILGDVNLIRLPFAYLKTVYQVINNSAKSSVSRSIYFRITFDISQKECNKLLQRHTLLLGGVVLSQIEWYPVSCKTGLDLVVFGTTDVLQELEESGSLTSGNLKLETSIAIESESGEPYELLDQLAIHAAWTLPDLPTEGFRGFGMHQEQLFSGRTMSLPAIMKDIYLLKQMNANVIRTSHYPYSSAYLDACDEHGIMVIAESPAVGLRSFSPSKLTLHKQILREMMWRDHHHKSIVMWSVANEPASQLGQAESYFASLLDYARTELAQYTRFAARPLTAAIAQSHDADRVGHLLDVIMINRYFAWYDYTATLEAVRPAMLASLQGWSNKHPDKPLMISEFGADTLAGLHSATGSHLYSEEFQEKLVAEHEKVFLELQRLRFCRQSKINFIGSMVWNFADFSTHESILRVGAMNRKGIFTRDREPKLAAKTLRWFYAQRSASGSSCAANASLVLGTNAITHASDDLCMR